MGKRRMTKNDVIANLMIKSINTPRTSDEFLTIGKKCKEDRNIQLGHSIAHGLDLIELMEMYDMTDEELIFFSQKHDEFISKYEHGNKDDEEEIKELFDKLHDRIGYDITVGKVVLIEK